MRNLLPVALKNYEARNLVLFLPWILASKWGRSLVGAVYYNGPRSLVRSITIYLLVLSDLVRQLPHLVRHRRPLQAARVLREVEIWRQ